MRRSPKNAEKCCKKSLHHRLEIVMSLWMNESEAPPTVSGKCWNLSLHGHRNVDPLSMSTNCGTSTVFCTVSTPALSLRNDGHVNNLVQEVDTTHDTATAESPQFFCAVSIRCNPSTAFVESRRFSRLCCTTRRSAVCR